MSSEFDTAHGPGFFLHIPRTGGTWTERVLEAAGLNPRHVSPAGISRHGRAADYELGQYRRVFTIVRAPRALYASTYAFLKMHEWRVWEPGTYHPWRELERFAGLPFDEWVAKVSCSSPRGYFSKITAEALGPAWPPILRVFRTENLAEDLYWFLTDCGVEPSRAWAAISGTLKCNSSAWGGAWRADTAALIDSREKWILRTFYGGINT